MSDSRTFAKPSIHSVGAIALFLLTFLVYTPALNNDFVNWDDDGYVYENRNIQSLNLSSLYWMVTSFHEANWHPLTWLSLSLDYALWGLNPLGYHLTNIILHGSNTLLVFLLVIQLIMKAQEVSGIPRPFNTKLPITTKSMMVASVTALLFGLHPLHVESVAWVAERKDLLCSLFAFLTLLSYLSYTSSMVTKHRCIWFALCLLLFIFALMSKPMAVTLPVTLLLLDLYPLKRISLHNNSNKNYLYY
jgi:fumarate reductase subunit C